MRSSVVDLITVMPHLNGVTADNKHWLQVVMKAAAPLVADAGRYEHVTLVLGDIIHWMSDRRIIFKIAVLTLDCIRDTGSVYFNVCTPWAFQSASC